MSYTWREVARMYLDEYPEHVFMTEDVRAWAYENGCPRPGHERSWGGVIKSAKEDGTIVSVGYDKVKDPDSNQAIANVWRKIKVEVQDA